MDKDRGSKLMVFLLLFSMVLIFSPLTERVDAQNATDDNGSSGGAGAIACCFVIILIPVLYFIGYIFIVIWVYFDAKGRGMDHPELWVILAWFLDIIGLIIYLIVRPNGQKEECPHCRKKSLISITTCPFCKKGKDIDVTWE